MIGCKLLNFFHIVLTREVLAKKEISFISFIHRDGAGLVQIGQRCRKNRRYYGNNRVSWLSLLAAISQ